MTPTESIRGRQERMKKNLIFTEPLKELADYEAVREKMRRVTGIIAFSGCVEAQKAEMIAGLSACVPVSLVVSENDLTARTIYENVRFYDPDREEPILCRAGEYIRFVSIGEADFKKIESDVKAGSYHPQIETEEES